MRSLQSAATDAVLQKATDLRKIANGDMTQCVDQKIRQNARRYKMPATFVAVIRPKKYTCAKTACYRFGEGKRCILYFHGGSYVDPPMIFHWRFLQRLAKESGATVVLPIYGRAPGHTCDETVPQMVTVYKSLGKEFGYENITVMGDSAGGGLSLAVCETLAEKNIAQPSEIILLSPWLDVDMKNPEISKYEKNDVMLTRAELMLYGTCYLGDNPRGFYMASPINNVTAALAPVYLFVGGSEMFLPDCLKFKHIADEKGAKVCLYEFPYMQHVFPLMPIPEAAEARKQIVNIIRR